MTFPQAERIALRELETLGETAPLFAAGSVTPADLEEAVATGVGYVRVTRAGGPADEIQDFPLLRLDVFHKTLAGAEDIAEAVRTKFLADYLRNEHGLIDRVTCVTGHQELPWENTSIRRLQTIYQAVCRRTSF